MRRIYLILVVVLLIFTFWAGHKLGLSEAEVTTVGLEKLYKRDENLTIALKNSEARFDTLAQKYKSDSVKVRKLEADIPVKDAEVRRIKRSYENQLAKIARYNKVQEDSFYQVKYFGSDTVYNINSKKIIANLLSKEGTDSINTVLTAEVALLKTISIEKDTLIADKDSLLTEALFQKQVLSEKVDIATSVADHFKAQAKKIKRQRNTIAGAALAVVAGSVYLSLKR